MTVILSQVSFWLNRESVPARTVFGECQLRHSGKGLLDMVYYCINNLASRMKKNCMLKSGVSAKLLGITVLIMS